MENGETAAVRAIATTVTPAGTVALPIAGVLAYLR